MSITATALEVDLTVIVESGKSTRMGRPPLNIKFETKPTMVRLTEDVRNRIEALVGKNRMAEFIREAVEKELKRRERDIK